MRKDGLAVVAVSEETQLESEVWWLEAMLPCEGEKGWRRVEEKGDYPAEATPASARVRRIGFQCYFTFFLRGQRLLREQPGDGHVYVCLALPKEEKHNMDLAVGKFCDF